MIPYYRKPTQRLHKVSKPVKTTEKKQSKKSLKDQALAKLKQTTELIEALEDITSEEIRPGDIEQELLEVVVKAQRTRSLETIHEEEEEDGGKKKTLNKKKIKNANGKAKVPRS